MGENCSATSRLIVHENIKDDLMRHILAHAKEWHMGDPLDPKNHLGCMIDSEHFGKVAGYLDVSKNGDDIVTLCGGKTADGFVEPTIFDQVTSASRLARDEIFGPVLGVMTVTSIDEAIALANDTDYGLAASVYTTNVKQAMRAARAIRAGTVTVNCYGEGDATTPFGGYKQSGFGGRDNGIHAHDQYCEVKTIWIDLTDRAASDAVN
jgi:gamma-glutamyl-gamma-aminobutyraldehyde dehydrogenase